MLKPDQKSKVTLEDLLRLKRVELPSPEFWVNFEKELRQKQLTALVQKRHWWHQLPVLINRRIYIPAGAAAIMAFSLVTIRYSVPTQVGQMPKIAPRVVAEDSAVEMLPATVVVESVSSRTGYQEGTDVRASARVPEVLPANLAAVPALSLPREVEVAVARPLVAALSRLEQPESDLMESALGNRLSVPARIQPASVSKSEVASMTPASTGKYQLIARYAERSLSPAPTAPAVVRERLARRLGDDLGDSISRIGVVGSRVSLKF